MTRPFDVFVGWARIGVIVAIAGHPAVAFADPPAVREADSAIAQADREAVRLLQILDEARRARTPVQIACVDSQLSQVNSMHRLLLLRRDRLRDAQGRADHASVAHERQVVRRMVAEVSRLARAGRACVYPPAGQANRTIVEVTISRDIQHQELDPAPPPP